MFDPFQKPHKILIILLCLLLCFQQTGLAQVAAQLDIAGHLGALRNSLTVDRFRPLHLRYLQYLPEQNSFRLLVDKGDFQQASLRGPATNLGGDEAISTLINSRNLTNLTSKESWSQDTYFNAYKENFTKGQYNIQEPVYTPYGQTIRTYFSGGISSAIAPSVIPQAGSLSFIDRKTGSTITVLQAIDRILASDNPYLLAADILEVSLESRSAVLENLVVRLSDTSLSPAQIQQRVNEIDDAHYNVAPEHYVGPRNPDGTYTKGAFEPKDIHQKSKKDAQSYT